MTKILIDSNILVYSTQSDSETKHDISEEVLHSLAKEKDMVISIQNLVELCSVLTEKMKNKMDPELASSYVLGFTKQATILSYSSATIVQANSLAKQHKIHFYDALLVATMQENGVTEIMTEDVSDFSKIPGLIVKNPFQVENKDEANKKIGKLKD